MAGSRATVRKDSYAEFLQEQLQHLYSSLLEQHKVGPESLKVQEDANHPVCGP